MHTQCPQCNTVFHVTEEILAVKEGLVRCGECEHVFNATWNLVSDPDALVEDFSDEIPDSDESDRAVIDADEQSTTVDEQLEAIDEGHEADTSAYETAGEAQTASEPESEETVDDDLSEALPEPRPEAEHLKEDNLSDAVTEAIDHRVAGVDAPGDELDDEELDPEDAPFENPIVTSADLDDDDRSIPMRARTEPVIREPDTVEPQDREVDSYHISEEEVRRTLRLDEAIEVDLDTDSARDDETVQQISRPDIVETQDIPANRPAESRETQFSLDPQERLEPLPEETAGRIEPTFGPVKGDLSVTADDALVPRPQAPGKTKKRASVLTRKPAIKRSSTPKPRTEKPVKPDPELESLSLPRSDPNVHWVSIPQNGRQGHGLLWATGVLLMLVLVVAQVRFFLVEELYSIPSTRPYISIFCEFAGCEPPVRIDPQSIHIAQTRVDLHPDVPGALSIKINLINKAGFAQPYPPLQVTLTDKDGRIVGRRTYTPEDYLGENAQSSMLDPGILSVTTLSLAHPNENAVGFETILVN